MKRTTSGLFVPGVATAAPAEPERAVVDGLPAWLNAVTYRAADDVITIAALVPDSQLARAHVLAYEMTPEQARALLGALAACLTRSEQTVVDVAPDPASAS